MLRLVLGHDFIWGTPNVRDEGMLIGLGCKYVCVLSTNTCKCAFNKNTCVIVSESDVEVKEFKPSQNKKKQIFIEDNNC